MNKVLLLDDAKDVQDLVRITLQDIAELECAETISDAYRKVQANEYDLFIIDLGLPDGNGLSFLTAIQNHELCKTKPIIILSSNKSLEDRVTGYKLGADDYLTKPFERRELSAIVESKLQKIKPNSKSIVVFADLIIDLTAGRVFKKQDGDSLEVFLTPLELKILTFFIYNKDNIITRQQILTKFWSSDMDTSDRVVDSHISALRKKLGPTGNQIKTIYGSGYILSHHRAA